MQYVMNGCKNVNPVSHKFTIDNAPAYPAKLVL
jgi:hypothetical protein